MARGKISGEQFSSGAIFLGGNCPEVIIRGTIIQGAIALEP